MTLRRLDITRDAEGNFFLQFKGDSVIFGTDAQHTTCVKSLRVVRIHCEVEGNGDQVTVHSDDPNHPMAAREVKLGEVFQAGGCRLRLDGGAEDASSTGGADVPQDSGERWLVVLDGPERGQTFLLPAKGAMTVGRERNHADVALRDLHIARVQCRIDTDGAQIMVTDQSGQGTTLINGKKIGRSALALGDTLRVGNTNLRLQDHSEAEDEEDDREVEEENVDPDDELYDEKALAEDVKAEEEIELLPDDASVGARQLHAWRLKAAQIAGQTFGQYKLGALVGRGRCGLAFLAEEVKSGQKQVLKVLSPQFPRNDEELQNFARVFKSLLPLRHAHLVNVLRAGKTGTHAWIAREYVEGISLSRVLRRLAAGMRPRIERACRVGVHIGRALEFARKNRCRHGQVTPSNIIIQRKDRVAKLADLMMDAAFTGTNLLRAAQEIRPTAELAYLSPEQAEPGAFVDELSDLYGLGAVLFALLTGRPPFVGESAQEILEQVRTAAVPRPGTINDNIPAALDQLVVKLLAKRQEDRYQTPTELLADLEPIAEEAGVEL